MGCSGPNVTSLLSDLYRYTGDRDPRGAGLREHMYRRLLGPFYTVSDSFQ